MTLWVLLLTVLALAAFALLFNKAPWVPADWKPIIQWVLLVVLVIVVLDFFGALEYFKNLSFRR